MSVSYQVRNGVAWLTIQRPEARNALNKAVRDGLFDGVRTFNADDTAKVLVLTGAPLSAARAHEIGFVNRLAEPDELIEVTQALAEQIAANAPLSVAASKQTAALTAEHPLSTAYKLAETLWAPVYLSNDAQEGPRAFNEGRPPRWKGA
ncbi:MAG: enoyl-CoA hydratase-related protein [Mycobacterium sp.]|uniref:enoyl-CoA hydratase-related protein n=1 Tax=Mycobacterium sp. TaxID=1785 RepID=UPI003BB1A3CD